MSDTENVMIPESAIEAAAKGLATQGWGEWDAVPNELRRAFLRDAKIALEAAAPHMLADAKRDAWEEGYTAADYDAPHSGKSANPYEPEPLRFACRPHYDESADSFVPTYANCATCDGGGCGDCA